MWVDFVGNSMLDFNYGDMFCTNDRDGVSCTICHVDFNRRKFATLYFFLFFSFYSDDLVIFLVFIAIFLFC